MNRKFKEKRTKEWVIIFGLLSSITVSCSLGTERLVETPTGQDPTGRTPPASTAAANPATAQPEISFSFLRGENDFTASVTRELDQNGGDQLLSPREPFLISHAIPEQVRISVNVPNIDLGTVRVVDATGQIGLTEGPATNLEVSEFHVENGHLTIRLTGVQRVFSELEENRAYIRINLRSESSEAILARIQVPLITPPTAVRAEQLTVSEYERRYGAIHMDNKTLPSYTQRLSLLQVVKLRNSSEHPIALNFNLQPRGILTTHFRQIQLSQQPCTYSTSAREWDENLATEFYLIPITEEMRRTYIGFINQHLALGRFDQAILPGEEKLVGLYGAGSTVASLMANGHTIQRMAPVQAVSGCAARCRTNWPASGGNPAMGHWANQGFPGESRLCYDLKEPRGQQRRCDIDPRQQSEPQQCLRCALWELQNGVPSNDFGRRFCPAPSGEGWVIERSTTSITAGTESNRVYLRLTPESIAVDARYQLRESEESPARSLGNLLRSETIQAE